MGKDWIKIWVEDILYLQGIIRMMHIRSDCILIIYDRKFMRGDNENADSN